MIYSWITRNIKYDDVGLRDLKKRRDEAEAVLKRRMGVCLGISNLFVRLGELAGLNTKLVVGWSKGGKYSLGDLILH